MTGLDDSDRNILHSLRDEWKDDYDGCDICGVLHDEEDDCPKPPPRQW